MPDSHYIPTAPGTHSLFAADSHADPLTMTDKAAHAAYAGYIERLQAEYKKCCVRASHTTVCFGVAQRINQLIFAARHQGARLVFSGPFAPAAARALIEIAGGALRIEDEFPDVAIVSAEEVVAA